MGGITSHQARRAAPLLVPRSYPGDKLPDLDDVDPEFYPVLTAPEPEEWQGAERHGHAVLLVGYDAKMG